MDYNCCQVVYHLAEEKFTTAFSTYLLRNPLLRGNRLPLQSIRQVHRGDHLRIAIRRELWHSREPSLLPEQLPGLAPPLRGGSLPKVIQSSFLISTPRVHMKWHSGAAAQSAPS